MPIVLRAGYLSDLLQYSLGVLAELQRGLGKNMAGAVRLQRVLAEFGCFRFYRLYPLLSVVQKNIQSAIAII
jgi:hypothetical protein